MGEVFTALGVFVWITLGACMGATAMAIVAAHSYGGYAPYAELLGGKCWLDFNHEWHPHRIVGVTHKGSIIVRPWDDDSAKAFWVTRRQIERGMVAFDEEDCI